MWLVAGNFLTAAVLVPFPPCSNPSDDSQIFRPTDVNAASLASSGGRQHLCAPDCRPRPNPPEGSVPAATQTLPASDRLESAH